MPTNLPDTTTQRRKAAAVTRRTFLRFLALRPIAGAPAAAPSRFTALSPDIALWLRCWRSPILAAG